MKLSSAAVGMAAAVTASPAYAVIEERMGGEGAGAYGRLPLGINDPILGFVLGGVVRPRAIGAAAQRAPNAALRQPQAGARARARSILSRRASVAAFTPHRDAMPRPARALGTPRQQSNYLACAPYCCRHAR